MCLNTLTVKRTFKKSKKIFKLVTLDGEAEYPPLQFSDNKCNEQMIMFPPLKQLGRKTIAQVKTIRTVGYMKDGTFDSYSYLYKSGFHCFTNKNDAKNVLSGNYCLGWRPIILDYTIPAGTEVQYGRQYGGKKIIVAPVLINPRLSKKGKKVK